MHTVTWPRHTTPGNTEGKEQVRTCVYKVQQTGDTLAQCLDISVLDIQGPLQLMHKASQGISKQTQNLPRAVQVITIVGNGRPDSMGAGCRNLWEQAAGGSK
jgi:hypothetical protein